MESLLGMVFVIIEHWLLLKFSLENLLRGEDILEEEEKNYSNGYHFADDLIRRVHNEDASSPILFWLFESKF